MNHYSFLWKGKDPEGVSRSERVTAENAQQARDQLTRAGWTDLELLMDEISDSAKGSVEAADWMKEQELTPDQEREFFEGKGPGFFGQWIKGLYDSRTSILLFGAVLAWGIYRRSTWLIVVGAIPLAFLVLFGPALQLFFGASLREYARLNKAKVWGKWEEVLKSVERLRKTSAFTRIGIGDVELARCRSQALAALGRLDDAIEEFRRFENSPRLERFLYLSHLGGIYDIGKAHDRALECQKLAAAEKPDNSAMWIDLAYGNVRYHNNPAAAREALVKAEQFEITGIGKAYLPFLRGIICWREGKFEEAKRELNEALAGFQPLAHQPLMEGLVLLTKSYLCAVHGALGEVTEARTLLRATERFLVANKEDEILQACRAGVAS